MIAGKRTFRPVTSSDVCEIYELLHSNDLVSFPLTEEGRHKIESIVASITGSYFGVEPYPSIEEKVVAYLYFIIKDHAFTDGNKRTASLTFYVLCGLNGLAPDQSLPLDSLAVFIEKVQEPDYRMVIKLIAKTLFNL